MILSQTQLARAGQPNAHLKNKAVSKHCRLDTVCHQLLEDAAKKRFLSPRACQRILKVARTLAEAISYRMAGSEIIRYCGNNQG